MTELRPCMVNGKKALFHRWSDVSQIREAILIGSVSGVIADTFAIIEYESGVVERVNPSSVVFCDNIFKEYCFVKEQRITREEALEKQIPKKPNNTLCPTCGESSIIDGEYGDKYSYCYNCGQAIDWEVEE